MNILKVTKDAIDVLSFSSEVKRSHLEPVEVKGEKTAKEAPMEKSRFVSPRISTNLELQYI